MIEVYSDGLERLVLLAGEIVSLRMVDAEQIPIKPLVDFYSVDIYWEFQLFGGVTTIGITSLWDKVIKNNPVVSASVMNLYSEFRIRGQLDAQRWKQLLAVLSQSLSMSVSQQHSKHVVANDYVERSPTPEQIEELLHANPWVVPLILLKLGSPLLVANNRRR